jgi:RsiW-degrading membrane proteinase PrsW (M82 family)
VIRLIKYGKTCYNPREVISLLRLTVYVLTCIGPFLVARWLHRRLSIEHDGRMLLAAISGFGTAILLSFFGVIGVGPVDAVAVMTGISIDQPSFESFISAGLTEELFKFISLYLVVHAFDGDPPRSPLDRILPALWIGAGFAMAENLFYAARALENENGLVWLVVLVRSLPGHAAFGLLMGSLYALSVEERFGWKRWLLRPLILVVPALAHGTYNSWTSVLLWALYVAALWSIVLYVVKRIRRWVTAFAPA